MLKQLENKLKKLKDTKPLVLNLTNYVTMDFMANTLLALGAAPIMTTSDDELEELVQLASSININIGTLDEPFIKRCYLAATLAKQYQKPLILDPVGAGASLIRTKTASQLIEYASIVRGNASEIIALANQVGKTLGVESTNTKIEAQDIAIKLANRYGVTIVVSGSIDFITDGKRNSEIPFGSSLMPLVTGMGCTLTSVIAAFKNTSDDSFESSVLATLYFGLCGQLTEKQVRHPGQFRTTFIDNLHKADFEKMREILEGDYEI